jgi:hypothetical protein
MIGFRLLFSMNADRLRFMDLQANMRYDCMTSMLGDSELQIRCSMYCSREVTHVTYDEPYISAGVRAGGDNYSCARIRTPSGH